MQGNALATIVREVGFLGREHERDGEHQLRPEEDRLLNESHVRELEELALKQVRDAAQEDLLLHVPELPHILYKWRVWADEDEVRGWVERVSATDQGLIALLEKFLQRGVSHMVSDRVGG